MINITPMSSGSKIHTIQVIGHSNDVGRVFDYLMENKVPYYVMSNRKNKISAVFYCDNADILLTVKLMS